MSFPTPLCTSGSLAVAPRRRPSLKGVKSPKVRKHVDRFFSFFLLPHSSHYSTLIESEILVGAGSNTKPNRISLSLEDDFPAGLQLVHPADRDSRAGRDQARDEALLAPARRAAGAVDKGGLIPAEVVHDHVTALREVKAARPEPCAAGKGTGKRGKNHRRLLFACITPPPLSPAHQISSIY